MNKYVLIILIIFSLPHAFALENLKFNDTIIIKDQINDNFYGIANSIQVLAPIKGDFIATGSEVKIADSIEEDVLTIGAQVNISSSSEDVRAIGAIVDIDSNVKGDLIVIGGEVNIHNRTVVEGDCLIIAEQVVVEGIILGDLEVRSDETKLGAIVRGDSDIKGMLKLLPNANLKGNLTTETPRLDENRVAGQINKIDKESSINLFGILSWIIALSLIGQIILKIKPKLLTKTNKIIASDIMNTLFIGMMILFLVPILSLILLFSFIGASLGFSMLFVFLSSLVIGVIFISYFLGFYLWETTLSKKQSQFVYIVTGAIVISVIPHIPMIGSFGIIAIFALGLGTIYRLFVKKKKKKSLTEQYIKK